MTISSFLQLVELRTKVASVIPYLFGTFYTLYAFDTFRPKNALLMFLSMIIFDMTTTAINNYIDYKKAIKKDGYGYEVHNAITFHGLNIKTVRYLIYGMLFISALLGIILALNTDIVVLLLGILCFAIGVLYTFGPLPISRTPFGEVFSGITMGLVLTFISIYIHIFDQNIISFSFASNTFLMTFNFKTLLSIGLVCMPLITCIANIMLANNICDMEEDFPNRRFTLPIYIGKEKALILWKYLYYFAYIAIFAGILLKVLPLVSAFTFITLIPVMKNIRLFEAKQFKGETFIYAIKNFMILNLTYILTMALALFFN